MEKHVVYNPTGVCCRQMEFDLVEGRIHNVEFHGGCRGNSNGITHLIEGREAVEVTDILKNIDCRNGVSCPQQLAIAVLEALDGEKR